MPPRSTFAWMVLLVGSAALGAGAAVPEATTLEHDFATVVKPFLSDYCLACHGARKQEGKLDLSGYVSATAVVANPKTWAAILARLEAEEMPPEEAPRQPRPEARSAVIAWIRAVRAHEGAKNAGDPGPVPSRRLSHAEFNATVRDLTGVDLQPAREFPVDPANEAGFDNSGESLTMSPALLRKYLAAARRVADHLVLTPSGVRFAPHPVVTETDRDKYCVGRIVAFYERHRVDYADHLLAAWKFQHRDRLGKPDASLRDFARGDGLDARYLETLWTVLSAPRPEVGPLGEVQTLWAALPTDPAKRDEARRRCERIRDLVIGWRQAFEPHVGKLQVRGISAGSQPLVLWRNRQLAAQRMRYPGGGVILDAHRVTHSLPQVVLPAGDPAIPRYEAAFARFCRVFPDAFFVVDRGPYFDPKGAGKGRPLTAGFHLMQGYFRDDAPLRELVLDEDARRELDALWDELNVVAQAPLRQYKDFIFFERAEPPRFMKPAEFDFARSEDKDASSEAKLRRLSEAYLAKARGNGATDEALTAIETYFTTIAAEIRHVEQARRDAEPRHLEALGEFARRAYRRPLAREEKEELLAFYRELRGKEGLGHEDAIRDTIASVLMSPHFLYRADRADPGAAARPLSDVALASRLSYFLWSSMPDDELLAHAHLGDLHEPAVLVAQARRMIGDDRIGGLAAEFAGNWLDFRRFEEHNGVDRGRFANFTNELRRAMYEEPLRFFIDVARRDRSVLDLLVADDTFVNPVLARHYAMPVPDQAPDSWFRVVDARRYGRGGLLPMAIFLTKNSPGLRTSPVKRGYWVVRRVLGETIPPPPPTVPELPKDEAKTGELTLPQLLARHRDDRSCLGCHRRFDSIGLAFEGYGPIGERRTLDLGGRPVVAKATFPDGRDREGLDGLRRYLAEERREDFLENLCRKLLAYALGRSLLQSDEATIRTMRSRLEADRYRFHALIETIVTSPQFLNKRGRDDPREP